jgi:heptosyltransferase-2
MWILEAFGNDVRRQWWNVVRRLQRESFDLAILLTNNILSATVAYIGQVKRRVGYDREFRGWMLTDRLRADWSLRGYRPVPIVDYYLKLAKHMGATADSPTMELFLLPEDRHAADEVWSQRGLRPDLPVVTLNPGAAFGPAKRWPEDSFAELARQLVDRHRAQVLILCGPAEQEIARKIEAKSERRSHVWALADPSISIGRSKAVVARSDLLVSTDSGPRHFAPAFGVPVVSLFGPTRIEWTETYYPGETKLQKAVPCGPCQRRVCPQGHHQCMRDLTVAEVFQAASDHLQRRRQVRVA